MKLEPNFNFTVNLCNKPKKNRLAFEIQILLFNGTSCQSSSTATNV